MLSVLVLNRSEALAFERSGAVDVGANNVGILTMMVPPRAYVAKGDHDRNVISVEKPIRRISQVGVITVSPTDQPEIALERMYEFDENQPVFCVPREHSIELFQVA